MKIEINKEIIKKQVEILRDFLIEKDFTLAQSTAYIVIAKMHGYKDWNVLSAILKTETDCND